MRKCLLVVMIVAVTIRHRRVSSVGADICFSESSHCWHVLIYSLQGTKHLPLCRNLLQATNSLNTQPCNSSGEIVSTSSHDRSSSWSNAVHVALPLAADTVHHVSRQYWILEPSQPSLLQQPKSNTNIRTVLKHNYCESTRFSLYTTSVSYHILHNIFLRLPLQAWPADLQPAAHAKPLLSTEVVLWDR